jgi:hypothetical protein
MRHLSGLIMYIFIKYFHQIILIVVSSSTGKDCFLTRGEKGTGESETGFG